MERRDLILGVGEAGCEDGFVEEGTVGALHEGSSIRISEPSLMSWRANALVPLPGLGLNSKGSEDKVPGLREG